MWSAPALEGLLAVIAVSVPHGVQLTGVVPAACRVARSSQTSELKHITNGSFESYCVWHYKQLQLICLYIRSLTKLESFNIKIEAICVISPQHYCLILHKRA